MNRNKTLAATTSAIDHLEKSMKALIEKNETDLMKHVWLASSEVEYVLFLFSLELQNEASSPVWKPDSRSKQFEIKPTLMTAQNLLKEAKNSFEANDLDEAREKTRMARDQLLRAHDFFEKKLRKGEKSASSG